MSKPPQIPVAFSDDHLHRLRFLATESGRSIASIVREAVALYLEPGKPTSTFTADDLWRVLQDPVNWTRFKEIAVSMEAATGSPVFTGSGQYLSSEPAVALYRYKRPEGVASRAQPPTEQPPF